MLLGPALGVSAILFSIGVLGVLIRRNAIIIFMCVELMLNAVNLSFVGRGAKDDSAAQIRLTRIGKRRRRDVRILSVI